jgi:DNA replication licensing factor MCM6
MPRSMDVIVRDELTEKYFIIKRSKPGDRCVFVGSLIAVPDISSLVKAGERAEMHQRGETIRKNLT